MGSTTDRVVKSDNVSVGPTYRNLKGDNSTRSAGTGGWGKGREGFRGSGGTLNGGLGFPAEPHTLAVFKVGWVGRFAFTPQLLSKEGG